MPAVIEAGFRYWRALRGLVPLELLLWIGVRQLGDAIARQGPLELDFAGPLCALCRAAARR